MDNNGFHFEHNQVQGKFQIYALGPKIDEITVYNGYVVAIGTPVVQSSLLPPNVSVTQRAVIYDSLSQDVDELLININKDFTRDSNGFRRTNPAEIDAAAWLTAKESKRAAREILNNQIDSKIGLQRSR